MTVEIQKRAWTFFLALNLVGILVFWLQNSRELLFVGLPGVLIMLGRLLGLLGGFMILLQFFFMGRLPFLERVFGLDTLSRYHQKNGKWGMVLILFHPLFLMTGASQLSGVSLWSQYVSALQNPDVQEASIGLFLFLVVVATSLYLVRSRLKYESWYFVHLVAYLAVFFSFEHQFELGSDLLANRFFYGYWIVLYLIVFGTHLIFRFLMPTYRFFYHGFAVSRVVRETPTTVSVYITGRSLSSFPVKPGQFMLLRFFARGFWYQSHPFSLSSIPRGNELRVTVKELGDFTKMVQTLQPGTRVFVDGPYGVFTSSRSKNKKVLLVAGGIGITPLRALFEEMSLLGTDVVLLNSNRSTTDLPLHDELEDISKKVGARLIDIIADSPLFSGEKGRIDEEKIRRLVPDVAKRDVYLCGPPPMISACDMLFHKMGVPENQIHHELFAF